MIARHGVWHGAMGAGGDNRRERETFGAEPLSLRLDLEGDAALGPAWLDALGDRGEGGVADINRALECFDLGCVLDGAHVRDDRRSREDLRPFR